MNLYYFHMDGGNVGDDLNGVLWRRLFPELAGLRTWDWMIGIGSILDGRIDGISGSKIVMGTGYRPSGNPWRPASDVTIAAVRGKLTAQELGLDDSVPKCDPGFLVPRLFPERSGLGQGVGFIPHFFSEGCSRISHYAADRGLDVISPRLDIETFVRRLHQCSRVYCESMHAAIFADAFRIPWARVKVYSHCMEGAHVSDFKWRDAFSITDVDTTAVNRTAPVPLRYYGFRRRLNRIAGPLRAVGEFQLAGEMAQKADDCRVFRLSDESRLQSRVEGLVRKVNEVARQSELVLH